jgi:hypothetical protein
VTFSAFARQNVTAATVSGVFRSDDWNLTGTFANNEYVQFTLTPASGYALTMQSITFDVQRSAGGANQYGPRLIQVSIFRGILSPGSGDGNTPQASGTWTLPTSPTDVSSLTGQTFDFTDFTTTVGQGVTVRFYGWDAKNKNDWLQFDNVAVNGIAAVPEPANVALACFGLLFAGVTLGRRVYTSRRRSRAQ